MADSTLYDEGSEGLVQVQIPRLGLLTYSASHQQ